MVLVNIYLVFLIVCIIDFYGSSVVEVYDDLGCVGVGVFNIDQEVVVWIGGCGIGV